MDAGSLGDALLYRIGGAAGGAAISILVIWPRSVKEAGARLAASIVAGTIFAPVVLDWRGWPNGGDFNAAAACLAALFAWWLVGRIVKLIEAGWLPWGKKQG